MNRYRIIAATAAMAAFLAGLTPVFAQTTTFRNYHCADGSEFIVGFYPYDSRAYLQIDGGSVMLPKRAGAVWHALFGGWRHLEGDQGGPHHDQAAEAAGNGVRGPVGANRRKGPKRFRFDPFQTSRQRRRCPQAVDRHQRSHFDFSSWIASS